MRVTCVGVEEARQIMTLFRPSTVPEVLELLKLERPPKLIAGGTDILASWAELSAWRCVPNHPMLDLTAVERLRSIEVKSDETVIGGGATWTDIVKSTLPPELHALQQAARAIGGIQIQNRGTIGGNICNASPAADGMPPLLAVDAQVDLVSSHASRSLPLSKFVLGNRQTALGHDEILKSVRIPRLSPTCRSSFFKLGARRYLVISITMVAMVIDIASDGTIADLRISVGACSAKAQRLTRLEQDLTGKALTPYLPELIKEIHMQEVSPIDDLRATGEYRNEATLVIVRRMIRENAERFAG